MLRFFLTPFLNSLLLARSPFMCILFSCHFTLQVNRRHHLAVLYTTVCSTSLALLNRTTRLKPRNTCGFPTQCISIYLTRNYTLYQCHIAPSLKTLLFATHMIISCQMSGQHCIRATPVPTHQVSI